MEKGYYHTQASVQEYIHLAKDVNGQALITLLAQVLPLGSTVLEIGSGPGTDWRILSKSYQVTGSDNSAEFLAHLRTENPNGEFLELDAITLHTDNSYDGIYSNKVMHHLKDEELAASIQRQAQILSPNGVICHSFWKGEGTEVFKGMFVNYHTEAALNEFFKDYFEVISIESYAEFEAGDSLLLMGRRK